MEENKDKSRCDGCLWNERGRCGKNYCVLPRCVRPWKNKKKTEVKKERGEDG